MQIRSSFAGAVAVALACLAEPAAAQIFQSIPDLTVAPSLESVCSQCAGNGQSVGETFSLSSSGVVRSITFAVNKSVWPVPVTIGIYNDLGGAVGSNVYNATFSSFASDTTVSADANLHLVSVNVSGGLSLSVGSYVIFLTNPATLYIPAYSNLGSADGVFIVSGSTFPLLTGDLYSPEGSGRDIAVSLSDAFVPSGNPNGAAPEPSTWALILVGFAGLGMAAARRARRDPPLAA